MSSNGEIVDLVDNLIKDHPVMVFSATYCSFCTQVKNLFKRLDVVFHVVEVDIHDRKDEIRNELVRRINQRTVPQVFINGEHIGGCDDTMRCYHNGTLFNYLEGKKDVDYDFDLIVIGGGSGGIATAKQAAILKKKVALFDFVTPTNHGTVWGVGGTCVNVGCIPKKLMHQAAILGELFEDAKSFGWKVDFPGKTVHDWRTMIKNVQKHVKLLNFNYVKYFKKNNITYFNAFAKFIDDHTVESTDKKGITRLHSAQTFVLATGGRPRVLNFKGCELAITSDDLFSLKEKPDKIIIIGASYIGLECAGFLNGLGVDVTVVVREIMLRGFDQKIADIIGEDLKERGVKFIQGFTIDEVISGEWKTGDEIHKLEVKLDSIHGKSETERIEYCDVVLLAVGRDPNVGKLGLESTNVRFHEKSKKVLVDEFDRTDCKSIYAIGDIQHGRMELTPVAIKAGKLLAFRLYAKAEPMDYNNVPTTIFTPLEYGCCGLSEEAAKQKYGLSNIETFNGSFRPLEWVFRTLNNPSCYVKLVCIKNEKSRVVGFHVVGPNAGEITQGFALAVKMKAKKSDFDSLVGIHPTNAEVFTNLTSLSSTVSKLGSDPNETC